MNDVADVKTEFVAEKVEFIDKQGAFAAQVLRYLALRNPDHQTEFTLAQALL